MRLDDATAFVEGLPRPHLTPPRGAEVYAHVLDTRPQRVLELGSGRGGSTLYLAAALEELGNGHVLSVDSCRWPWRHPTAEEFLARAGLGSLVTFVRPFATYNWFLKDLVKALPTDLREKTTFDLIFVDGAKDFSTVGLSFVMASRLLHPGGWLVCDDLGWSYGEHCESSRHFGLEVAELSDDERAVPHVGEAFDLFVAQNEDFRVQRTSCGWVGWAQRIS